MIVLDGDYQSRIVHTKLDIYKSYQIKNLKYSIATHTARYRYSNRQISYDSATFLLSRLYETIWYMYAPCILIRFTSVYPGRCIENKSEFRICLLIWRLYRICFTKKVIIKRRIHFNVDVRIYERKTLIALFHGCYHIVNPMSECMMQTRLDGGT